MNVNAFQSFPQENTSFVLSYGIWLSSWRSILSSTGTRLYGFIGTSYTTAEFEIFQLRLAPLDHPVAFTLLRYPMDFRSAYPPPTGLNADEQRVLDAVNLPEHNRTWARYEAEQRDLTAVRTRLIASISPEASLLAGDPTDGFAGMSVEAVFAAMARQFGRLTGPELDALEATLDRTWITGTIAAHVAHHVRVHEVLHTNGATISTIAKIQRLAKSLSHLPASDPAHSFHVVLLTFRDSHPDLTRWSFATFAETIRRAGFEITPSVATTISAARKKPASSSTESARRQKVQDGPQVYCSHHGMNRSHVTERCQHLAREGRKMAGGGATK